MVSSTRPVRVLSGLALWTLRGVGSSCGGNEVSMKTPEVSLAIRANCELGLVCSRISSAMSILDQTDGENGCKLRTHYRFLGEAGESVTVSRWGSTARLFFVRVQD